MVKLLLPYFEKIEGGKALAEKMWAHSDKLREKQIQKSKDYDFKGLIDVIATETFPNGIEISTQGTDGETIITQFSDETENKLAAFRAVVLAATAVLGDSYDINELLKAALEAYDKHFKTFTGVNVWNQRAIFCVKVIGFIQSLLPREDAEVWCEGIWDVVNVNKKISARARKLKLRGGKDYYCTRRTPVAGLGREYFIDDGFARISSCVGVLGCVETLRCHSGPALGRDVQKLCKAKAAELGKLKKQLSQQLSQFQPR